MSAGLYGVRVYFEGRDGIVKAPGLERQLSAAPVIPGLPPLDAIDYAPAVACAQLQPRHEARRDMSGAECVAMVAWLRAGAPA